MAIEYTKKGNYNIPNITRRTEFPQNYGIFGEARKEFLLEQNPESFTFQMLKRKMQPHLMDVQDKGMQLRDELVKDMIKCLPENYQNTYPIEYLKKIQMFEHQATEIVMNQLVYVSDE